MGPSFRLRRRRRAGDDGFTIIEAIVALAIAAVAFMSLGYGLIGGLHVSLLAQQNQQAGDLLNQAVEQARDITYSQLAMVSSDLGVGDPSWSPSITAANCYNPSTDSTSGGSACEPLYTATGGSINPHVQTVAQNGLTYTIRRYITQPTDASSRTVLYHRYTAVISWTSLGKTHSRSFSTIFSYSTTGLPLPNYRFVAQNSAACANPSATIVYTFKIINSGAADSYSLTYTNNSTSGASPSSFTFYPDTAGTGVYSSTTDTTPLSTDANGNPETSLVQPNSSVTVFAVATAPAAAAAWTTTFTADSEAQPGSNSPNAETQPTSTNVITGACGASPSPSPSSSSSPSSSPSPSPSPSSTSSPPTQPVACGSQPTPVPTASVPSGSTLEAYFLHNAMPNAGNTTAQSVMAFNKVTETTNGSGGGASSTLWDYSTDLVLNAAGRDVTTSTGSKPSVTWSYTMPSQSNVQKGSALLTLYVEPATGSTTSTVSFSVTLKDSSNGTLGTATGGGSSWCSGFEPDAVSISLPNSNTKLPANDVVQVTVTNTSSTVPFYLAYDTTTFAAQLDIPYSSGVG